MSLLIETLKNNILDYKYNPNAIARLSVDAIEQASNGEIVIVDVTNPLVALISLNSTMTASWMQEDSILNRKQYKFSAQTVEDLYPHMSDKDHVDRFAVPSYTSVIFAFDEDELVSKMVDVAGTGMRRVTIPRNTKVKIGSIVFGLQYPIHINQLPSGSMQVMYDTTQDGPLRKINDNVIKSNTVSPTADMRALTFEVELDQFDVVSRIMHTNKSTANVIEIDFEDEYCAARVWMKQGDVWTQIAVSYTDEIYSHLTPTAIVQVLDGKVRVRIPQIYVTTDQIAGSVRIDVYSTKGPLDMALANYTTDNYEIEWYAIDKNDRDQFVAPLPTLRTADIYSSAFVRGGAKAMTFEQLYKRVTTNSIGIPDEPITPSQVENAYERDGFAIFNVVNNLTNRVYLATRTLPAPTVQAVKSSTDLLTACGGTVEMFNDSIESISSISTVRVNGLRATILPTSIFKQDNGLLVMVRQDELDMLSSTPPSKIPDLMAKNRYLFSPFHHVLDTSGAEFTVRSYWLDDPVVNYRSHEGLNPSTLLDVATAYAVIGRHDGGYNLVLKTRSGDTFKQLNNNQVYVQISYRDEFENMVFLTGELFDVDEDGERSYKFNLGTNYSLDEYDRIQFTTFSDTNGNKIIASSGLNQKFNVVWAVGSTMPVGWTISTHDDLLSANLARASAHAVTYELLDITFGAPLKSLWSRARSVITEEFYERWPEDVIDYWEEDVFDIDPVTGSAFKLAADGVTLEYLYKHRKGDPKLDADGNPVIKYDKGTVKLDANGKSVVVSPRKLSRQFDMMLLDAVYRFSTTQQSKDYVLEMTKKLVVWINTDVTAMDKSLLENTEIFFQPTKTIGSVDVMYDNSIVQSVQADHAFRVTLHVSPAILENKDLRAANTRAVVEAIDSCLVEGTVSVSDLQNAIREKLSSDVYGITASGFGDDGTIRIVTMVQKSHRLSIRKRLAYRNDGLLGVEEDVNVEFIGHNQKSVESYKSV